MCAQVLGDGKCYSSTVSRCGVRCGDQFSPRLCKGPPITQIPVMKLMRIYWAYPVILFNCIFHKTKTWRDEVVWIANSRVWIRAQARWCPDALYQQCPLGHVPTVIRKPRLDRGRETDHGVWSSGSRVAGRLCSCHRPCFSPVPLKENLTVAYHTCFIFI